MCSALFRTCCTPFQFFMRTINMFLNVTVYGTYFFYIRLVYLHNLFHITHLCILFCVRAVICQIKELFTTFINTNITITCVLFIFRRVWSLFLYLIIIRTWIFFMFICFLFTLILFVDAFQFVPINRSNFILNLFIEAYCSIAVQFNYFGT